MATLETAEQVATSNLPRGGTLGACSAAPALAIFGGLPGSAILASSAFLLAMACLMNAAGASAGADNLHLLGTMDNVSPPPEFSPLMQLLEDP